MRAARAAVEMRRRSRGTGSTHGSAINTGEVVVGGAGGETLVTGDAVNVAARLEQAAPPGEVLIGTETQLLVRDAVRVEPVEPLELKGKSEPVDAYRLLDVVSEAEPIARDLDGTARRTRTRAAAAVARVRGRCRRPHVSALHAPRSGGYGQVATRRRLPRPRPRRRGRAARPLPLVRRGDHVLAARRDAGAARDRAGQRASPRLRQRRGSRSASCWRRAPPIARRSP